MNYHIITIPFVSSKTILSFIIHSECFKNLKEKDKKIHFDRT